MWFFRAFAWIVLLVLAIGLGGAVFQSGYLAGLAVDGGGPAVPPGYGYGWGWGWGFGGGIFGILALLFFLFLFIGLLRAAFGGHRGWGHGPRGWGGHDQHRRFGPWEDRAREAHDEWHRRQDDPARRGDAGSGGASAGPSGSGPA